MRSKSSKEALTKVTVSYGSKSYSASQVVPLQRSEKVLIEKLYVVPFDEVPDQLPDNLTTSPADTLVRRFT